MTPEEWQALARVVTDPLPPLSDQQKRGLTRVAADHSINRTQDADLPKAA